MYTLFRQIKNDFEELVFSNLFFCNKTNEEDIFLEMIRVLLRSISRLNFLALLNGY